MKVFYSRIPSAAVRHEFDGHLYAYIPHRFSDQCREVIEDFDHPRMMRFGPESFHKNGEAYVYFGKIGDALSVPYIPFGVTVEVQA